MREVLLSPSASGGRGDGLSPSPEREEGLEKQKPCVSLPAAAPSPREEGGGVRSSIPLPRSACFIRQRVIFQQAEGEARSSSGERTLTGGLTEKG